MRGRRLIRRPRVTSLLNAWTGRGDLPLRRARFCMGKLRTIRTGVAAFKPARIASLKVDEAARIVRRGTTAERGFGAWWQRESTAFRRRYPACAYCWLEHRAGEAEVVDHLYPHGLRRGKNDAAQHRLFRSRDYWVSACHRCHRGFKAAIEAQGIEAIDDLARRLGLSPLDDDELRAVVESALRDRT